MIVIMIVPHLIWFDMIRALLREVVRALRYDLPLHVFCAALFQATLHEKRENIVKDFEFKVCCCCEIIFYNTDSTIDPR